MERKKELFLSVSCFLLAFLLITMWSQQKQESFASRIAPEILRFHVLANSDSKEDQDLKLEVRTLLLNTMYEQLGAGATKDETRTYISNNHESLEKVADSYMESKGCDYSAQIELTTCHFPVKVYGDMVFPSGTYEAARVTIGKGEGRNWWCVLYPPLCFVDATYAVVPDSSKQNLENLLAEDDYQALFDRRSEGTKVQIKSKLWEMIKKGCRDYSSAA